MSSSPFGFPPPSCSSRILRPTRLSSPREKLSLLLSLDVTVSPRSIPFPSLLSSLPYFPVFSDLLLSLNHPLLSFFVSSYCLEISNASRSLSNKPISISIVLKSPVRAFSPSCCCPSPLDFPSLLPPGPAHFAPVRNNKRSTRGVTTPRPGRNRADLRPGSEKAIWANRTPPAEGGEGPADNEQPYGR